MKTKVTLVNEFHNTEVNVIIDINEKGLFKLSDSQNSKIHKELCGLSDCTCGGVRGKCYYTESGEFFDYEALDQYGRYQVTTDKYRIAE